MYIQHDLCQFWCFYHQTHNSFDIWHKSAALPGLQQLAGLTSGAARILQQGESEVWVYRGSRVRSPTVPVVLSVYQRGSLLDGLATSCDTKKFHDNESTHILHNFWTSTIGGSFPPPGGATGLDNIVIASDSDIVSAVLLYHTSSTARYWVTTEVYELWTPILPRVTFRFWRQRRLLKFIEVAV